MVQRVLLTVTPSGQRRSATFTHTQYGFSGASRVSPLKWRGTFGGIMEVKWSFWTQIGGSKSAIYISILPYIAPVMKQIHLFANKFDQTNIYDYELVFILTGSSLLIIAEW